MIRATFLLIFILVVNGVHSQSFKKWRDSVTQHILDRLDSTRLFEKGRASSFYCYDAFRARIDDTLSIRVVNFGNLDNDDRINLILIVDSTSRKKSCFYLGRASTSDDLQRIQDYFTAKGALLIDLFKLEILDLLVRCKLGYIRTDTYIHDDHFTPPSEF